MPKVANFEPHRRAAFGVAYRMLGSVADAEDMAQEAWVRWQAVAEPTSPRGLATTIVTRLCLDRLKSAAVRRESYVGVWLPEPIVTPLFASEEPAVDDRLETQELASMAMLHAMQTLSPNERAALVLREVAECGFEAIAEALGTSVPNARKLLSRAKAKLAAAPVRESAPDDVVLALLGQLGQAVQAGDHAAVVALMHVDATLYSDGGGHVSAATKPVASAENVAKFLCGLSRKHGSAMSIDLVRANGAPAVRTVDAAGNVSVLMISVREGAVVGAYIQRNPEKLAASSAPG